jgi:pimeloyl-ACP methyl ester carboxylesterase
MSDDEPLFERAVRLARHFELGPVRLHVRDWPGRHGPLVCLPDLAEDGAAFDALASRLAPRWRVLAVDPRGRGRSSAPAHGYGYQVHVADAIGLLDLLGVERAGLVGRGFGALVATLLAAWYPTRAGALVVEPGSGRPGPRGDAVEQDVRALRDARPDLEAVCGALRCPTLVVPPGSHDAIEAFLRAKLAATGEAEGGG